MVKSIDNLRSSKGGLNPADQAKAMDQPQQSSSNPKTGESRNTKTKSNYRRRDIAPKLPTRDALVSDGVVVAARLSPAEATAFDGFRKTRGYKTRGAALRALVRASAGILALSENEAIEFETLRREINGLGGNVNQLTHLAQVGKLDLDTSDRALLQGLESAMIQLRLYLSDVVNEHRRRNIRLFQEFVEAEHGR